MICTRYLCVHSDFRLYVLVKRGKRTLCRCNKKIFLQQKMRLFKLLYPSLLCTRRKFIILAISQTFFEYEDGIFLLSLIPQSGPTHGDTEVYFLGPNLIDSSDLFCRFLIAQKHTKSFAKYFNKDNISCVVPAIQTEQRSVSIHSLVDVSINGVDFSKTQGTFLYHPPEEIDANITVKG